MRVTHTSITLQSESWTTRPNPRCADGENKCEPYDGIKTVAVVKILEEIKPIRLLNQNKLKIRKY
ncbi:hypothetical protein DCAR_0623407 [Daucus carota subsp. sativus]|uniref:Uncharacterized protein n=1 Tax=Daucus carota subsp. sativus TaxID=79200 RepID=A0A164V7D3_DAUCS|nr:hypothetical protein DCAR_0623407 [Daucus carota subsp. sativus]